MTELSPFETRLAKVIRSMADRADTRVDAVAVATDAIGPRRLGPGMLPWLRQPAAAMILFLLALSLAMFGLSALVGALRDQPGLVVPPPISSPIATTTVMGYVTGQGTFSIVAPGASVVVDDGTQVRGFVASSHDVASDPRATGTGTLSLDIDTNGAVGREWGTYRLETADGVWLGTVSGAAWSDGNASDVAGYLVGSGAYAGLTYYIHVRSVGFGTQIDGIIYPGLAPGP